MRWQLTTNWVFLKWKRLIKLQTHPLRLPKSIYGTNKGRMECVIRIAVNAQLKGIFHDDISIKNIDLKSLRGSKGKVRKLF